MSARRRLHGHRSNRRLARITGGNFRLVQRLFAQITRILEINEITTISRGVLETAREALIIGKCVAAIKR